MDDAILRLMGKGVKKIFDKLIEKDDWFIIDKAFLVIYEVEEEGIYHLHVFIEHRCGFKNELV